MTPPARCRRCAASVGSSPSNAAPTALRYRPPRRWSSWARRSAGSPTAPRRATSPGVPSRSARSSLSACRFSTRSARCTEPLPLSPPGGGTQHRVQPAQHLQAVIADLVDLAAVEHGAAVRRDIAHLLQPVEVRSGLTDLRVVAELHLEQRLDDPPTA